VRQTEFAADGASRSTLLRLAGGYWRGDGAWRAYALTAIVAATMLGQIGVSLGVNAWNRWFFDALGKKDLGQLWLVACWLPAIVLAFAFFSAAHSWSKMTLQVRWRAWLTDALMGWWVADQRYYRLAIGARELAAPEFRIAEDVRLATEPLADFADGLLTSAITAASFAAILWSVAGSAEFWLGGIHIVAPAYMALAAVAYAVIVSVAVYFIGRPLVGRVADKNESEASFRADMTRLRENSESIALIRGDEDELGSLRRAYAVLLGRWLAIVRRQGLINLLLATNSALFPVLPLLLAAPKYFSGSLTLGGVIQVAAAFSAVQGALIWFVDNFIRLAEWAASARRVAVLVDALKGVDAGLQGAEGNNIEMGASDDGAIHIENLSIADPGGRVFIRDASIRIDPGEKVLIAGESGSGKSTLVRALAGLWPWGSGSIRLPSGSRLMFVPQRPYVPQGALREVLFYPVNDAIVAPERLDEAMRRCGIGYLIKRLDEKGVNWDQTLSGGERQRIAFCRLALQRPDIIVMDEATSALDDDSQHAMMTLLHNDLAASSVISVAHRAEIEEFHDRKIVIVKQATGANVSSSPLSRSFWRFFRTA